MGDWSNLIVPVPLQPGNSTSSVGVGGGGADVAGTARATRGAPVGVGLAGATSRCTTFGAGGAGVQVGSGVYVGYGVGLLIGSVSPAQATSSDINAAGRRNNIVSLRLIVLRPVVPNPPWDS